MDLDSWTGGMNLAVNSVVDPLAASVAAAAARPTNLALLFC